MIIQNEIIKVDWHFSYQSLNTKKIHCYGCPNSHLLDLITDYEIQIKNLVQNVLK